jgi:transaldolase
MINMGVRTTAAIYNYAQQQGSSTRIVVTGLRKADEVLALSGVDYMILSDSVCKQLAESGTLHGYNDGLAADTSVSHCGIPALTPEAAMEVSCFPRLQWRCTKNTCTCF